MNDKKPALGMLLAGVPIVLFIALELLRGFAGISFPSFWLSPFLRTSWIFFGIAFPFWKAGRSETAAPVRHFAFAVGAGLFGVLVGWMGMSAPLWLANVIFPIAAAGIVGVYAAQAIFAALPYAAGALAIALLCQFVLNHPLSRAALLRLVVAGVLLAVVNSQINSGVIEPILSERPFDFFWLFAIGVAVVAETVGTRKALSYLGGSAFAILTLALWTSVSAKVLINPGAVFVEKKKLDINLGVMTELSTPEQIKKLKRFFASAPAWSVETFGSDRKVKRRELVGDRWRSESFGSDRATIELSFPDTERKRSTPAFSLEKWQTVAPGAAQAEISFFRAAELNIAGLGEADLEVKTDALVLHIVERGMGQHGKALQDALDLVRKELTEALPLSEADVSRRFAESKDPLPQCFYTLSPYHSVEVWGWANPRREGSVQVRFDGKDSMTGPAELLGWSDDPRAGYYFNLSSFRTENDAPKKTEIIFTPEEASARLDKKESVVLATCKLQ